VHKLPSTAHGQIRHILTVIGALDAATHAAAMQWQWLPAAMPAVAAAA
jgi:hypothetical protein